MAPEVCVEITCENLTASSFSCNPHPTKRKKKELIWEENTAELIREWNTKGAIRYAYNEGATTLNLMQL